MENMNFGFDQEFGQMAAAFGGDEVGPVALVFGDHLRDVAEAADRAGGDAVEFTIVAGPRRAGTV